MKELIIKLLHISYKIYEHNLFIKWMNEIIKNYIRQASCRIVVNKLQKVLTYVIHWQMMKNHVSISFAMLECAWKYDVKIGCKEVAYNCMWITLYIQYYI